MRVLALRADSGGCAFYRVQEPARVVSEQFDVDITVDTIVDVEASKVVSTGLTTITEVKTDVDLIIIQRPLDNSFTSLIKQAKKQGIATIVELDDDLESVHPNNTASRGVDPRYRPHANHQWIRRACEEADLVTVSTTALTKFAPHGRFEIIRNAVPASITEIEHNPHEPPVVGWTGTIQTHPTDLQVTRGRVWDAAQKFNAPIHVVGDSQGVGAALGIPYSGTVSQSGWVPLDQYYTEIAKTIDIGIVPLDKGVFNTAKSYLKGLEYAGLGIPFIATSTQEYKLLSAYGIGMLASSPGDWSRWLDRLLSNPSLRSSISLEYKEKVFEHFTYEINAYQWYNAWQRAIDIRKESI